MDMGGPWMLDAGLFVFMATTAAEIMTEKDGQKGQGGKWEWEGSEEESSSIVGAGGWHA